LQRFRKLIPERDVAALDAWLADAQASTLAPFVGLANGIVKDRAAVEAALTMPWSTSMVEGHIHRVKLIKRQGYGRSSFALLRRRILVQQPGASFERCRSFVVPGVRGRTHAESDIEIDCKC